MESHLILFALYKRKKNEMASSAEGEKVSIEPTAQSEAAPRVSAHEQYNIFSIARQYKQMVYFFLILVVFTRIRA